MPSKELTRADLIEDIAKRLCSVTNENPLAWVAYKGHAEGILSTILAALHEPTEGMREVGMEAIDDNWERGIMRPSANSPITCWRAMLAASALGEQSE